MSGVEKQYFIYKEKDGDYYWEGPNKEKIHFCGHPKFIVQSLITKFGPAKGQEIFNNFMEGVKGISEIGFKKKGTSPATFVLYKKKDDNKNLGQLFDETLQNTEKKLAANGEDA
ncbi:MAG TPA: hypothetical protein PLP73_00620 [Candidatus Absconditabacterales bacterium]|nr:hypothetical protein [Candidatus Absconditabacterales bacterium]